MSLENRFLLEPIIVEFDNPPLLEKKPHCPDRFIWDGKTFHVVEIESEWIDRRRRGRMSRNMRPTNLSRARERGSWGVGRNYYRVRVRSGRLFELYYDRAPQGQKRKGVWILSRELL